jgi:metal-sulfur cluster biosynthetic enzyme
MALIEDVSCPRSRQRNCRHHRNLYFSFETWANLHSRNFSRDCHQHRKGGASAPRRYEVNLDIHERPVPSALCRGDIVATVTQDEVLSALKQCYDPEIPVNIVDLGLIYDVHFEAAPEEKQDVKIDMTLTSQGCPAHVMIGEQVKARLEQLPGIRNASVNVVWTPPWSPERLSPEARKQLGIE